ncbi:MAG: 3'-5' exonuclease [Cryobacterium sp.]
MARPTPAGAAEPGFCVLGLESTALVPGETPRIVELAIVQVNAEGESLSRWHTLVDPGRGLGPFGSHGLNDDEVRGAPAFAQIAARVSDCLAGRVVVAHNAGFVFGLLAEELGRAGLPTPDAVEPVCTMQLARDLLPGAGRSLADCGAAYGLEAVAIDGALGTAAATTALLRAYLQSADCLSGWTQALDRAAELPRPVPGRRGSGVVLRSRPRAASRRCAPEPFPGPAPDLGNVDPQPRFSTRAPLRLPDFTGPAEQLDYLALLDRCLVDRTLFTHAPAHPLSVLAEHARRACIDPGTLAHLHHSYAEDLLRVALADGALTPIDRAELVSVTRMLGADPSEYLADGAATAGGRPAGRLPPAAAPVSLTRGDTIVLTETLTRGAAAWAREIAARGFTVAAAVTLRTRLVVAADPTVVSGKTGKARDYGIPIVSEFALRSVMGID